MIFHQFRNEPIAALSYLIGCSASGEAAIVDPSLPAEQYILAAADHGLRITALLETHMHADYYSTGRALAQRTHASIYAPAPADVRYPHHPLRNGDRVQVGNISLRALHTPGHTPEHTAFVVAEGSRSYQPWFVLTGDCLFVGDVGRADLLDLPDTGPESLYTSLFDTLLRLPDYVEIFPAHYGGSACGGKQMSSKTSSTIGYERRFNWALQAPDCKTFAEWTSATPRDTVEAVLEHRNTNRGKLPLPEGYYRPLVLSESNSPPVQDLSAQDAALAIAHGAVLIDLRRAGDFVTSHSVNAINVVYSRTILLDRLAALVPQGKPIVLFADQPVVAHAAARLVACSGRNPIHGYVAGDLDDWKAADLPITMLPAISIDDLYASADNSDTLVIDVRGPSEWANGIIAGARLICLSDIREQLASLPRTLRIITICESGTRAVAAASLLHHHGFHAIAAVASSGMSAYAKRYPTIKPQQMEKAANI